MPTIGSAPARPTRRTWLGLAAVALAGAVWAPITRNYFRADDFVQLLAIANGEPLRFLLLQTGGHACLARNIVFYASALAFGPQPAGYFVTVLATHLVNVALLFTLVRRLAGSARVAFVAAALWGTSPLGEATLGWYSVFGQVLVTTVVLAVLLRVVRARDAGTVPRREAATWAAAMLLATTLFGVGIGMAIAFPVAAWLILRGGGGRPAMPARLWWLPLGVVGLYALLTWLSRLSGEPAGTLQAYVLARTAALPLVVMLVRLVGSGIAGLAGGFWCVDGRCALAALCAAGYVAVVLAGLCVLPAAGRRTLAGLGVVAVGGYAIVALGRAPLGVPAAEPRYQYACSAVLAAILGIAAGGLVAPWRRERVADAAVAAAVLAGALAHARSGWAVDHFDADRHLTAAALAGIDAAIDAAPPGEPVYVPNRTYRTRSGIIVLRDFPGWAGLFAIFHRDNVVRGHRVHFVARDAAELAAARPGTRLGELLVAAPPGATPPASAATP